jgi:hypothetical protein
MEAIELVFGPTNGFTTLHQTHNHLASSSLIEALLVLVN